MAGSDHVQYVLRMMHIIFRTITFTPSKPLPRDALPPPTIHLNRVTDTAVMKDAKQFAGTGRESH